VVIREDTRSLIIPHYVCWESVAARHGRCIHIRVQMWMWVSWSHPICHCLSYLRVAVSISTFGKRCFLITCLVNEHGKEFQSLSMLHYFSWINPLEVVIREDTRSLIARLSLIVFVDSLRWQGMVGVSIPIFRKCFCDFTLSCKKKKYGKELIDSSTFNHLGRNNHLHGKSEKVIDCSFQSHFHYVCCQL
jgi:hypothetical protein